MEAATTTENELQYQNPQKNDLPDFLVLRIQGLDCPNTVGL